MKPVTAIIPNGSILDPSENAAVVGGNVLTSQRIVDVIFRAFQVCAASQVQHTEVLRGLDIFYYPPFLSLCFNFIIHLLHRKTIFKMAFYILGKFLNMEHIVKSNSLYFPYFQQVIEYDFRISTKMTQMQFVWRFFCRVA